MFCQPCQLTPTLTHTEILVEVPLNPFTTGNPFSGTKLLGFSIGRGSGALKGVNDTTGLRGLRKADDRRQKYTLPEKSKR